MTLLCMYARFGKENVERMTEDLFKHDADGDRNISYQGNGVVVVVVVVVVFVIIFIIVFICIIIITTSTTAAATSANSPLPEYLEIVSSSDMLTAPVAAGDGALPPPDKKKAPKAGKCSRDPKICCTFHSCFTPLLQCQCPPPDP